MPWPTPNQPQFPISRRPLEQSPVQGVGQAAVRGLTMNAPRVMPGANTPEEAVAILQNAPMQANEPQVYAKNLFDRQRELETRYANDPDPRTAAFLGLVKQEIAQNPDFGEAAQAKTAGIEAKNLQANLGGFATPQEAEEATRQAETYKVDAPVRAQQMAGQFDVEKQRLASQGALDVAREQGQGSTNFLNMMQQLQQSGGAPDIRSITAPRGGGSISFAPQTQAPAAIQRDVTTARQNLAKAQQAATPGMGNMFGLIGVGQEAVDTALAQYKAAIDTALANFNIQDPESKQAISEALMNPENKGKSIDQIFDLSMMTPDEQRELTNFVTLIGGF